MLQASGELGWAGLGEGGRQKQVRSAACQSILGLGDLRGSFPLFPHPSQQVAISPGPNLMRFPGPSQEQRPLCRQWAPSCGRPPQARHNR